MIVTVHLNSFRGNIFKNLDIDYDNIQDFQNDLEDGFSVHAQEIISCKIDESTRKITGRYPFTLRSKGFNYIEIPKIEFIEGGVA